MVKKKEIQKNKNITNAKREELGIHVITGQDIENHFANTEINGDDKDGKQSDDYPKIDVNLKLDRLVWEEVIKMAEQIGVEPAEYVETALMKFNKNPQNLEN